MVIATIFASSWLAHRLQSAEFGDERVRLEAVAEASLLTVTG